MRLITLFLASLASSPLYAQTQSQPAPVAQVKPLPPMATAHIRKAEPIPNSFQPKGQARLSTAQREAVSGARPALVQLPGLTLTGRDGSSVSSSAFQHKTRWILLFRSQTCLPCDRLMNVLAASASPDLKNGEPYVIVTQGSTAGLEAVHGNYANLGNATWLADSSSQVMTTLKPHGSPTLYGMEGDHIQWTLPGNLGDPTRVDKFISGWLASAPRTETAAVSSAAVTSKPSTPSPR